MFKCAIFGVFTLTLILHTAECQLERMMMRAMMRQVITDMMVRAEVDRAVKFIVGESAQATPEMYDYAISLGREPRNKEERDTYLHFMKQTARQTPDILKRFINIDFINGRPKITVDHMKLDAQVTRRSLMYSAASRARRQRQKEQQEAQRKHQEELDRIKKMHELNLHAVISAVAPDMIGSLPTSANPGPAYDVNNQGTAMDLSVNMMLMDGLM